MKCVLFLCMLVAAVWADESYTDKYDNVELEEILKNKKLFDGYYNCIMETGKCTAEGKELKTNLPDALENECVKCTEKQKNGAIRVIKHLIENDIEKWKELTAKYDPDHKWAKKYEDRARAEGIVIP